MRARRRVPSKRRSAVYAHSLDYRTFSLISKGVEMKKVSISRGCAAVACLVIMTSIVCAQTNELGKVEFPTSGSPQAQEHFLRGLAALHSFWYEEALEAFREATKVDPDFMMGYWGEAMTHNHPLWSEQDPDAARRVLAKLKDTPKLTERERAYLNAVKVLFGDGDKRARDNAYSTAMEKIYRAYPDDLDAA